MGGQRIDDHGFWAGRGDKGSVFPDGVHTKSMDSAEGAGEVDRYRDTEDEVLRTQEDGERKIDSHRQKDHYRH